MDKFKQNMENALFSNKTIFIKNKRQPGYANNINVSNSSSNLRTNTNSKSLSNLSFKGGEYNSLLLWILLFIIAIIISYLTVMTAKYLSTDCQNKRSWFNYIFRFCYNDVCIVSKTPVAPVINNLHLMKPGTMPPKLPIMPPTMPVVQPPTKTPEVKKGGNSISLFGKKEVFHISNQDYTFEQAKCKCESYNAKLATYDQLVDAFNDGAEWCTYGWSSGQKAYYPTQKCNWEKKTPEERLKCGNPGLNGGFFADPYLKFGVNCYGKKPKGKVSKLKDTVCSSGNYCELPQNFGANNRLESDEISPFNNDKWNN
jgi:hypothetical protein